MRNKRVLEFGLAGLSIALMLQLAGYRMDHAVPRIALGDQMIYSWLTLLFSPLAFFLRLGNPDGPIVTGWTSFFTVVLTNAMVYALFCRAAQGFVHRLRVKLARESIPGAR